LQIAFFVIAKYAKNSSWAYRVNKCIFVNNKTITDMATETKHTQQIGNDTYVLNVCRNSKASSLVYQMWTERNGSQVKGTWSTKKRLDSETKSFFKI
jgi:hypothetical protein